MTERPTLLYIGSALPCRSETFVYREVLALRERGWNVRTASVHPPERGLGSDRLDALADSAISIYGRGPLRMIASAAAELLRQPVASARTFFDACRCATGSDVASAGRFKVIWQALAAMAIAEQCRRAGVDHVHAHMAHVPTTVAMFLARQLKTPFSFTGHAADLFRDRALLKTKLERCAFCCCISHWHREFYQTVAHVAAERLPIVRCGVDCESFTPDGGHESSRVRVTAVGRLVPKKGFDLLLKALEGVKSDAPVEVRILGDGPERGTLEALAAGLKNAVVVFTGAASNDEVREAMRHCDIFVLPCRVADDGDRDGIPVVLMEAMACGVPVVSGDLPAIRELIEDGTSGLLIQPGSVDKLAAALQRLAERPDFRQDLAQHGRKRIMEEFSLRINVDRLEMAIAGAHAARARAHRSDIRGANSSNRRYLLVSPCRNEAVFMRRTLDSVVNQTVTPTRWVIVDDGSTDETPAILDEYAQRHPFITVVRRDDRGRRSVGPGVIEAFECGLAAVDLDEFEYICKLDLDLDLPLGYFERLMQHMEADERLGSCSGKPFFRNAAGALVSEMCGDETSVGMTKFYRRACFQQIGGFVRQVMWDGIDCHRCRMLGWKARSFDEPDLRFEHLRPMGSSDRSILTGRLRHGFGQYFMGTSLLYMTASALFRMSRPPYIVGGAAMWYGYVRAMLTGAPRYDDRTFRNWLRRYQRACLFLGKRRATRRIDEQQAALWDPPREKQSFQTSTSASIAGAGLSHLRAAG